MGIRLSLRPERYVAQKTNAPELTGKSPMNHRMQTLKKALNNHPVRIIAPGSRTQAAVALILHEQPNGLNILFIERSTNENDYWSGQIAFPGGRAESSDRSLRHTAERETWEELGLDLSGAQYLGRLSDSAPGGLQIIISCFVYGVTQLPLLHPDEREIARAFWVPARELNNRARRTELDFHFRGRLRRFPAIKLTEGKEQPLWGLTYRLLRNFDKVIVKRGVPGGKRHSAGGE